MILKARPALGLPGQAGPDTGFEQFERPQGDRVDRPVKPGASHQNLAGASLIANFISELSALLLAPWPSIRPVLDIAPGDASTH